MKSHDPVRNLHKKVRKPAAHKAPVKHSMRINPAARMFRLKTEDKRLTFAGVYFMLWPEIRKARGLKDETARSYDRTMCTHVLKHFNGPAFEDMMERDFTTPWNSVVDGDLPYSALRNASVVIRSLMELAYQKGLTRTILWGLPDCYENDDTRRCEDSEAEGKRLARRNINNSRTFSLVAELNFLRANLEHVDVYGEAFGGLIMLLCGTRTSETTAFSFKHLTKVIDGYYALVRYDVSEKDSTDTNAGGKSTNAFRLLPLPAFLAKLLLQRKKKLEKVYSKVEVNELPICCKGTDYTQRCKQDELNEFIKNMYKIAKVEEDILADTYYNMHEDAEGAKDCEGYATAYLCRHQFATAMAYCGLTQGELYILMGHKIEVENVVKSDFSTPSKFRALSDKTDRRPCVYIFNRELSASRKEASAITPNAEHPVEIHADGDLVIEVPENMNFEIHMLSRKWGAALSIESSGACEIQTQSFMLPDLAASEDMSCYMDFVACAEKAWARVQNEESTRIPARALVEVDGVVSMIEEALEAEEVGETAEEMTASAEVEEVSETVPATEPTEGHDESKAVAGKVVEEKEAFHVSEDVPGDSDISVEDPEPAESIKPQDGGEPPGATARKTRRERGEYGPVIWMVNNAGGISRVMYPNELHQRNRAGKKLPVCTGGITPSRLFIYDTASPALLLSPEGVLYKVPRHTQLDSTDFSSDDNPAYRALKAGAVVLQRPELMKETGTIVCVANTGRLRKVSLNAYKRFSAGGRPMVTLRDGEYIVSACLCGESEDVLIMSASGMMLRIDARDLHAVSSVSALVAGMRMKENDQPMACVAYREDEEYLAVTEQGMAVRYDRMVSHMTHGTNTAGRVYVKLKSGDRVVALLQPKDGLYLVNNDGYSICCDMKEISAVKGASYGVITQRLKDEQRVVAALALRMPSMEKQE